MSANPARVVGAVGSPGVRAAQERGSTAVNNTLLIVVAVLAIILLIVGGIAEALQFLLWVGLILLIVAVVLFIVRMIGGRSGRV